MRSGSMLKSSAIYRIRSVKMFISSNKTSKIRVAILNDTNTNTPGHYGCSLVMKNLVDKLNEHNMQAVFFWPVGKDWRNYKKQFTTNIDCDALIVNGEGSIHHCRKNNREYLVEIASFSKNVLQIPCYLINSTLYSNSPEIYREIKQFDKCFVRESYSYSELSKFNIPSVIVPDLTFAAMTHSNGKKKNFKKVLVTDSTNNSMRKKLKSISNKYSWNFISMKEKEKLSFHSNLFRSLAKKFAAHNLNRLKKIAFMPVKMEERLKHVYNESRLFSKKSYDKIVDHEKFIHEIINHQFVITGRFHTVTLCIKTKTPFLAIESNTPKISALLNDVFGNKKRLISMEQLEAFQGFIPENFTSFSKNELDSMNSYNDQAQDKIDFMFREIYNDISLKKIIREWSEA